MDTRAEGLPKLSAAPGEAKDTTDTNTPLPSKTTLPSLTSNPGSKFGSGVGNVRQSLWLPIVYTPIEVSTKRRTPSIERFLGSRHESFWPSAKSTASNGPSTEDPETKTGISSALMFTLASTRLWITGHLQSLQLKIRKRSSGIVNALPFWVDIWAGSMPRTAKLMSSTESTAVTIPPDVIKTVPIPPFPIRVFYGKPPPFSLEAQRRKMRWRYRWRFGLVPELIQEPKTQHIQETVQQYIEFLDPETQIISVELLAQGAFNQAYNIVVENKATGSRNEYVFRVALPIYPYHKLESDVATTEFVRHTTTIPVPTIYAFDSSPYNKLGFEWMLMEKVKGILLYDTWDTMGYKTKQELTKNVANWVDQLSRLKFDKIGSLYCRQRAGQMEFYLGPTLHGRLYEGDRLLYDVSRGPFESLRAYYDTLLDATERYINDPKHSARHELEAVTCDEASSTNGDDSSESLQGDCLKSEDEILAQADAEDRRNERQYGVKKDDLDWLPDELRTYRALLPKLCPLPPPSEPMATMLTHPDISETNIFVNESGSPVALIDWERVRIEPSTLFNALPNFLLDDSVNLPDYFYIPPGSTISTGRKGNKLYLYGDEDIARIRGRSEKTYTEVMERIQLTHLRTLYREELKRLQSPICKAFENNSESLEQQLIKRVISPEDVELSAATDWAVEHLGESILAELDEEDASDDQEELVEGGETHERDDIVDTGTVDSIDT